MRIINKTLVLSISLIMFLFVGPVNLLRSLWYDFVLKTPQPARSGFVQVVYAEVLATIEEASNSLLHFADSIKEEKLILTEEQKELIIQNGKVEFYPGLDDEFPVFVGLKEGEVTGYAIKGAVQGKHDLIHFMVGLDPQGKIRDVMVLEYREKRGKPIAKRRFLKQFKGKTVKDKIRLNKDIRGVTGASISSRGMSKGVRKLVHIINEIYVQ